ncbi:MAG TPA: LytTR family DNA-binding domain-containing protein [Draconibacterium sp.]|nr:LytTR family DNA-binding domain-containing protein [Draconibacterium sp.]
MIKSIIVDDEKNGRENLAGILKQHCQNVELIGVANSVETAIQLIRQENPQLVFLDIEMPKANGFQLLEHFTRIDFEVIFITAYDNYAIKAIRFSAADYILKPINFKELTAAVEKVSERIRSREENDRIRVLHSNIIQPENPRLGLPTGDRIEFVEAKMIIHCKGEGNYTHIYLHDGNHLLVAKTLIEFEDLLREYDFVRTHKSHLVNLKHVRAWLKNEGGMLQLSNGDKVAVSRRRKDEVLKMLKVLIS